MRNSNSCFSRYGEWAWSRDPIRQPDATRNSLCSAKKWKKKATMSSGRQMQNARWKKWPGKWGIRSVLKPDFSGEGILSGNGYRVFYKSVPVNSWIPVYGIREWEYDRPFYITIALMIGLLRAIILSAITISHYTARNVTRPILLFVKNVEQVQNGNFGCSDRGGF